MENLVFADRIEVPLLKYMKALIIHGADEKKVSTKKQCKSFFKAGNLAVETDVQYDFKYPGEVLERYEEHCGGGIEQVRALGLALAETKMLLEDAMFVGTQYSDFLRMIRRQAKKDFYLLCILYLLTENMDEEEKLYHQIVEHQYEESGEALFAVFTLQDRPHAWFFSKKLLARFLGMERTMKAYGNCGVFGWVFEVYGREIRQCREKNIRGLKALLELGYKYVKEGTALWNTLKNMGYSSQEIIYLNLTLPNILSGYDTLRTKYITMERMTVASLEILLNSKDVEDSLIYELCDELIRQYQTYEIRLEGKRGILQSLADKVHIQNPGLYRYLYENTRDAELPDEWFYKDFSDKRWCMITEWMSSDEFTVLFGKSLCDLEPKEIDCWLDNYRTYSGSQYEDLFWRSETIDVLEVFRFLVKIGKENLVAYLDQYEADRKSMDEKELQDKWKVMKVNLKYLVKDLKSHEAYLFWEAFDDYYGIQALDSFFSCQHMVLAAVNIEWYSHMNCYRNRLDFKENILSYQEQERLFSWVEQMVYKEIPDSYDIFLYHFLMQDNAQKISPEGSVALFHMIKDDIEECLRNKLYYKYYSASEWECYQKRVSEQKEKERKQMIERKAQMCRGKINSDIQSAQKSSEIYEILWKYLNSFGSSEVEIQVCLEFLEQYIKSGNRMNKKQAGNIADRVVTIFRFGDIEWSRVKEIIGRMEVIAGECGED